MAIHTPFSPNVGASNAANDRRTTVTIWAPEASRASFMLSLEGNFPVPTIRREVNWRPAICKGVSVIAGWRVPPLTFSGKGE